MTLPASGAISFNAINVELGVAGTTQASLGQTSYRNLAGVASGQISMSNFYGKANEFAFTIASNQTNANLRTLAVNAGWNQSSKVIATIGSGVYVSSNSTGTPALTVNGSFPGGVELVNNGFIVGMGGAGGKAARLGTVGSAGGLALSVASAVAVRNNGTIGGGGGGGGGGAYGLVENTNKGGTVISAQYYHGSGGGGGRSGAAANSAGGGQGTAASGWTNYYGAAGNAGTYLAAGAGGSRSYPTFMGLGGTGGAWGAAGTNGANASSNNAGGATGGGPAGGAVTGNANITWLATGTRLGAIT